MVDDTNKMILLKELKLYNFLSHSQTTIKFEKNEKLLVAGKSGAGKSSIVDAIVWCLYNQSRSSNANLIKQGKDEASVVLELLEIKDGVETIYRIQREINSKGKHTLTVTFKEGKDKWKLINASGVREVQEFIEKKILKASYQLFVNSIICLQNNPESFVNQTATKKKDILLEIIGADEYDSYYKKAKESLGNQKVDLQLLESKINDKLSIIESNKEISEKTDEYKKKEKEIQKEKDVLETGKKILEDKNKELNIKKAELQIKKSKIIDIDNQVDSNKNELENIKQQISALDSLDIDDINKHLVQMQLKEFELKDLFAQQAEYIEWSKKKTALLAEAPVNHNEQLEIDRINKKIIGIMSQEIDTCPELDKICPILKRKQEESINDLREQLNASQTKLEAYNTLLVEHNKKLELLGTVVAPERSKINQLEIEINSLTPYKEKLNEANNAQEKIVELNLKIKSLEETIKKLADDKINIEFEVIAGKKIEDEEERNTQKIILNNDEIEKLNTEYLENHSNLILAEQAVNVIDKNKKEITELKKQIKLNKENVESLELVKDAFGNNGVKTIVIESLLPQLEDSINNILSKLSDFRIELSTQKSGVGKDTVIDGLFVEIINGQGEKMGFDNYSGSEKMRVSYAITEGLALLSKCGYRVIDELVGGLDNETEEKFVEVILQLRQNVNQLICISHLQSVQDLFEKQIKIIKINGDSFIK